MPVCAAVAEEERIASPGGEKRLLVADRHARGGVDEVAVAVGRAERAVQRRLGRSSPPASSSASIASRAAASASSQRSAAASRPRLEPRRPARGELGRVGAQDRRRPARRLVPAAVRVDDDLVGAARREPGPQRLAGRHLAEAQDQVGDDRAWRSARRAAAGRRRRRRASGRAARSGAARSARRGSGSRRRGRGGRAARAARGRVGGRRRSPRRSRRRCASATSSSRKSEGSRSIGVTAVSGRSPRPSSASGSLAVTAPSTGDRRQRLAPGQVEVDRARARLASRRANARQAIERKWSSPSSSASWVPTSQNQRTEEP